MYQDFKDLLSSFHAHGVKYLVVGGYAVSFHGQPRATNDMDLFIKAELTNAEAAYAALIAFGAPLAAISVSDLADPHKFVRPEVSRSRSTFFPASTGSIWTLHGKGAWRESSTRQADSMHSSFPRMT